MARAPIPCPVCESLHTRVRDTQPLGPASADQRFVRLFAAVRAELGNEGNLTGSMRVQLLECASCPPDSEGRPRVYRLTDLPPSFVETTEQYLRAGSTARN